MLHFTVNMEARTWHMEVMFILVFMVQKLLICCGNTIKNGVHLYRHTFTGIPKF